MRCSRGTCVGSMDSTDGVEILAEAARRHPGKRPVEILIEIGFAGGRTGCRSAADALAVAICHAAQSPAMIKISRTGAGHRAAAVPQ